MNRVVKLCVVVSAFLVPSAGTWADLPPLIPREVLFGNPDKASPRISPDGKRLAYLAPDEGVLNVWIRTVGKEDDRPVTHDRKRGIRAYFWAQNNKQILYIQDKDGDENWHVYATNLETKKTEDLTPFEGVQARIVAIEPEFPNDILLAINKRTPQLHDVYRADVTNGELKIELENEQGFVDFVADHHLQVRAAVKPIENGGTELWVRDSADSAWRKLTTWAPVDALNSGPVAFTPDGKGLYLINSANANTSEFREMDLATGKEKTLARDPVNDVVEYVIHPTKHHVQAVAFHKGRLYWAPLDNDVRNDIIRIATLERGDFHILNRDHADQSWLVSFEKDDGPITYLVYNLETNKAERLFTNRKALEKLTLAKMEPVAFKAGDGLRIYGYLTTPPGVPSKNLPMVLLVHGGPWYRDSWGYAPTAQWLANRGYAVLQVNFRGSTGYGKKFLNAANREWAGKMHQDLIDGVNWAINKGIADPKRIAIFGGSYGGYATLVGLTFTPDVFACGVDIVGPSNLITWMKTIPPYWKPFEPILWERVGNPEKDAEFLKSRSPLFKVDRITKPLLIAQGANDPRVPKEESLQMVKALKEADKPVSYVEYPDEGHGFARPENRLDFFAKAEKFLANHLGGRYEE